MDPLGEKRPWESPYCYTGGNPLNRIDPDGQLWNIAAGGIGALVGGTVGFVGNVISQRQSGARGQPGGDEGNWDKESTGEWLHRDMKSKHEPHFDYQDQDGNRWRLFHDGTKERKP